MSNFMNDVPVGKLTPTAQWIAKGDSVVGQCVKYCIKKTGHGDKPLIRINTDVELPEELGGERGCAVSNGKVLPDETYGVWATVMINAEIERQRLCINDLIGITYLGKSGSTKLFAVRIERGPDSKPYEYPTLEDDSKETEEVVTPDYSGVN